MVLSEYPFESFVFYRSFREAIEEMPPEDQLSTLLAICDYALYGRETKLHGMPKAIFTVARPCIDANRERRKGGKKGGRPPKKENHRFSENETIGFDEENHRFSKTKSTETETVTETGSENESAESSEPADGGSEPPIITIPLNDGTEYPVSSEQCQEWAGLYPAVDVIQQLREMRAWSLSNPTKKKTRRGILRFITGWLSREQDKGGSKRGGSTQYDEYWDGIAQR